MIKPCWSVAHIPAALVGVLLCSGVASTQGRALPPAVSRTVDFGRDIQPILAGRCVRCHGPTKAEGGLRLDRRGPALEGGNRGPAWEAGNSAASRLIQYISGTDADVVMPPSGKRLSAEEVGLLRGWVDQGAKWPGAEAASDTRPAVDHWAFRPVRRPPVPRVDNVGRVRNPVDHFIMARLEAGRVAPSPEADRATLVRRLSLDLLGLPPTVAEVDAFLADARPDAYERVVDRLLASPHYGERQARHWLDVARYADSDGYNADAARPVWKYRDWVVDAFNRDLPFDQFVIEQMAGDLLPGATPTQKTATGFHRNTLFNAEGGNDPEEFRVERVVDRVSTTGVAFLGLTVGCAECHEHKYDPVSQREFYELFAFFNNAEEVTMETPTAEEERARARHRARVAEAQARLQEQDQAEAAKPASRRVGPAVLVLSGVSATTFLPALAAAHVATDPARQRLAAEVAALAKQEPRVTQTLVLGAKANNPLPTRIHVRGDFRRPGAAVRPNVPRVLPPLRADAGAKPGAAAPEATRLELAHWLVSPENPLTARVAVNRVWQHYFGTGLVETENDFGTQGKPPSHPDLLDWLAAEFMKPSRPGAAGGRWGVKALHRLIVTSATYRQSSRQRKDLAAADPNNRLLGRQTRSRLEAENVRDVMLASAGLLSRRIGGPSVFPHQPPGVMETRRSPTAWVVSAGLDRHRRGMYTHFWRTSPHPFLTTFDAPIADTPCTRRHRSNTPLQALMLLNDPMFVECARALAGHLLAEGPTEEAGRVRYAFRLCLAREPSEPERALLANLLAGQRAEFGADRQAAARLAGAATAAGADVVERAAWTAVARVLLNLDEVITRE